MSDFIANRAKTTVILALVCLAFPHPEAAASPSTATLVPGDILAIVVHKVVGEFGRAPTYFPGADQDLQPAIGHPIQVDPRGMLQLPEIDAVSVEGLTVAEARDAIASAYLEAGITRSKNVVMLSLLKKRKTRVTFAHGSGANPASVEEIALEGKQDTLLHVLASAKYFDPQANLRILHRSIDQRSGGGLQEGTIILEESQRPQFYFTGGLIQGGQHPLPRNGMNALQAIAAAGGAKPNGILRPHQLVIVRKHGATTTHAYANLLAAPERFPVQHGDLLLLR